jgi:anaerobic selenocysteine-containing dehydrogenase
MTRYEKTVHSPRRLTAPLLRIGPKGSGAFRAVSWDEALDRVVDAWRGILAGAGAEAILPYSYAGTMGLVQRNAGHPFFHCLGASRLDRTICAPAKEAGWRSVMGGTAAPHPDEVALSDLVILWGINAVATNIHFLHGVREAKKRGAAVWLIETYETATARAAHRTFLVRPGSDGALALGIMHLLAREGLVDEAFARRHVQGLDGLLAEVLPLFAPRRVSELTGLSEETLLEMARAYGKARAPFIRVGSGLSRYGNGAMAVRAIVCLPAMVGAYGKRGAGCLTSTATGGAFAMKEIVREDLMARPTRIINMNRLGWALNELDDPPVQSLYVYHSNPAAVAPDQNRVLEGLSREELFTVVHERFMTDTARYADIVLPATSSLEHPDLYRSYGTYCVQRARAVIPPVGQSRSNWEVFTALAGRMGFEDPVFRRSAEQMIDRLLDCPHPWWEGLDRGAFKAGRAVELRLPPDAGTTFETPSGKIEILNPREPHPLPCYLPPHGGQYPFRLMTGASVYALNSSFREREDLLRQEGAMALQMNPGDAATLGLGEGDPVTAFNDLGEVPFVLRISPRVPAGVVVAEGVWWLEQCPGPRAVNALTSQRLTDQGGGSTFYDNTVGVRPCD